MFLRSDFSKPPVQSCAHQKKQFLIYLNKLQMLWHIYANDNVQFSAFYYQLLMPCWSKCFDGSLLNI